MVLKILKALDIAFCNPVEFGKHVLIMFLGDVKKEKNRILGLIMFYENK